MRTQWTNGWGPRRAGLLGAVVSLLLAPRAFAGPPEPAPETGHEGHEHGPEVEDRHEHHTHETDEDLHGGHVRKVVVELPTEGPDRPRAAASDLDIEVGRLGDVPRGSAQKLMTLSPGVTLINPGGENHPATIYMRGFDAGEGQNIEFVLEDVPLNDPANTDGHGFADTSFIIPELVTNLRFSQGSFDPRQGDFAIAGSAGYSLGLQQRGYRVHGEYGSFGTGRAMVLWGPEHEESGTFIGVDVRAGRGYGANRQHLLGRMNAGWAHTFRKHTHLRLLAVAHGTRFEQPGVVRYDDFVDRRLPCASDRDSQFFCTYDDEQGGVLTRTGLSARVFRHDGARVFSQNVFVHHRLMNIRENFTGFVYDARGDGLDAAYAMWTAGARGSYGLRTDWRERTQGIDFGYQFRFDTGRTALSRYAADTGENYKAIFDNDVTVANPALYVAAPLAPLRWLDLALGLRFETWALAVDRRVLATPDQPARTNAFALAVLPRASAAVKIQPWLTWLNAYGMGARSPDPNGLGGAGDGGLVPSARSHATETGFGLQWTDLAERVDIDARLVAFYTHVQRDLVFDEELGRNAPVGPSNRFGGLASFRTTVAGWLDLQASATWAEAFLASPGAGPFAWTTGERVPYIPRLTLRGDASLWHGFSVRGEHVSWSLSAGVGHASRRPLPLGQQGTPITTVDLAGKLRWRWIELGLDVQNLLDARYHELELAYASNFEGPAAAAPQVPMLHFVGGPPLSVMGTLTLYFEPGEVTHFRRDRARARKELMP